MSKSAEILIIEDNPADVRLIMEAFKDFKILNNFNVVTDGEEALHYLMHEGDYNTSSRPDFIILDLRLPKIDGLEVLSTIKSTPSLKSIPVIVLSGTNSIQDMAQSYKLNANCFISKPLIRKASNLS